MRTPLQEPEPEPASALAGFSVSVESEPVQQDGIHLVVVIEHDAPAGAAIMNPLDFLASGVLLLDGRGAPVSLPRVVSRLKVNTPSAALRLPFRLDFIESGGKVLAREETEAAMMHFQPRDELRIGITLDRGEDERPLPPGDYQVEIILRLAAKASQTRTFESPPIAVRTTS